MAFTIVEAEQRSDAWFKARLGRLTGSVASDMLSEIKTGESAGRRNLRLKLALERITGRSMDSDYISPAMQAGLDREGDARAAYELASGNVVFQTGFLADDGVMSGASLDGHLGDFSALVSIKCRQPAAHLEFLRSQKIPGDALAQIRHELWITGAIEHHYVSFNPDFPEGGQLRWVVLKASDLDIAGYAVKATAFLADVDRDVIDIQALSGRVA